MLTMYADCHDVYDQLDNQVGIGELRKHRSEYYLFCLFWNIS